MRVFLDTPQAKEAELIFLDVYPHLDFKGNFKDRNPEELKHVQDKLQAFYEQFGFKNRHDYKRMWLVKKGSIPTNKLPE